jgi:ABC-type polysaccharide/polyol phosphate transport system ATPase subunit
MEPGGTGAPTRRGQLRIEGVSKRFPALGDAGPVDAIADLTLEVNPGDAVGLIGPNGAGKSTVLKLVAGVLAPTAGRIARTGHTVAVIELGAGLHYDLTGRENVAMLLELYRDRGSELGPDHLDEIIEFSGLAEQIDWPVRHYSTGMIARLAFSVTAHADPDILLVDEVLSVGDQAFQDRCIDLITDLRRRGVTIVMVSHDLDLLARVCRRVVLLVEGRVALDGETDEVIRHYLGLPALTTAPGGLGLDIATPRVDAGERLEVRVVVPATDGPSSLRIEYVVPAPVVVDGSDTHMVIGRATVLAPGPGPATLHLGTAGLPAGRYDLQIGLEDDVHQLVQFESQPFVLDGPSGPNVVRLAGSLSVDGVVGATF